MLKSKKFWSYEVSEHFNLTPEIISNYKLKGKFYDDALYFYDLIGTGIHPSFKSVMGKEFTAPTVLSFQNIFVDINTLKILFTLIPSSKITTLRFSSNNLSLSNLEFLINSLLNKPNNIYNFTFEWNDKLTIDGMQYSIRDIKTIIDEKLISDMNKSQELLVSLVNTEPYKLEALCLRGNFIGDNTAIKIFEGIKNNTYLRILNLYKNDLTNECIPKFCEMLLVNRKLEEINFGGNLLGDQALELIKTSSGKFLMTAEEVENYNKLAKEKQDIINKNIKAKAAKKPEMEIPFLDEMEVIEGVNYIVKNATLRVLNLIQNNLTEKSFEYLTAILDSNQDLVLTVDLKSFTEKQHEILTDSYGKYFNRIYLSK